MKVMCTYCDTLYKGLQCLRGGPGNSPLWIPRDNCLCSLYILEMNPLSYIYCQCLLLIHGFPTHFVNNI